VTFPANSEPRPAIVTAKRKRFLLCVFMISSLIATRPHPDNSRLSVYAFYLLLPGFGVRITKKVKTSWTSLSSKNPAVRSAGRGLHERHDLGARIACTVRRQCRGWSFIGLPPYIASCEMTRLIRTLLI